VGCYGLAKAGKDFEEILRHYFPKGSVEKLGS
jgi:peptidoglycan hydrolase-like amidase